MTDLASPPEEKIHLLNSKVNIWFGCVRGDGRPHMTPVWFVWHAGKIFIGIDPNSVKSRSLRRNPQAVMALEDGTNPLICEGIARIIPPPYSQELLTAFLHKYEWDMTGEKQFHQVVEITPIKWLSW